MQVLLRESPDTPYIVRLLNLVNATTFSRVNFQDQTAKEWDIVATDETWGGVPVYELQNERDVPFNSVP